MEIYGPHGGFRDWLPMTPEQAWMLGDMLIQYAEMHMEDK